jgi:acyl-coenzyme A thioesterase PaaI-like protein
MADDHETWLTTTDPGQAPADLPFLAVEDTFVSGDRTGRRFRIRYYRGEDDSQLFGKILFGNGAQGPPDHVHGGAMAAILDEAMGGAAWQSGHPVVAANLDVSFRRLLPLRTPCVVEASIVGVDGRKITTRGQLRDREGETVFAEGRALFIVLDRRHLDTMAGKADVIVERLQQQRDRRGSQD